MAKSDAPEEAASMGMAYNLAVVKGTHQVHRVLAGLAHVLLARWMVEEDGHSMAVEEGDDSHSDKMSNDLDLDILQPPEVVHSHKAVELALVHDEGEVHTLVDRTSLVMIMEIVCQFHTV